VAGRAVVVPTYDGIVAAYAAATGRRLWRARLRAGINACPAVGDGLLVVAAGAPHPRTARLHAEVVAFEIRR
jgi:glucose dehydrogenase